MSGLRSSCHPSIARCAKALRLGALAGGLVIGFGTGVPSAVAATTTMVNLGQASTYAVISGASVGNTVSAPGAPHTTLRGDLAVKANAQPTGFPPGVVTGASRIGTTAAAEAHTDLVAAYNEVAGRTGGAPLAGALAGTTVAPGLHTVAGAVSNTTTVTLDGGGDPNAVFVFQINGAMAFAAGSHVVLTNGARASRVFWQVNGAGAIGANADFAGTLMALDAVGVGNSSVVNGRAFARNGALTLDNNQFYSAPPVVTIAGGATAVTTDTTPTIGGTTDVEAPGVVSVSVAGQTLTAIPSAGTWSVTSAILANATYPVAASVTDAVGNTGSAAQQLTVDTVLPVITIADGESVTTNDPSPTITGTSDAALGTVVRVTVGAQTRTGLVQADGTWNVTPAALTDATRTITAAVTDPAGNEGTDTQELTIDTAAPAVTIAGGTDALTNDATPQISGTAAVGTGTTVTVDLADETLTGLVQAGGAWSVSAAALSDGPHRIVISVSDAAGNRASATQRLTVDTVAPVVAITGGATATTNDTAPTLLGTSDAAPGTTVTVSIGGQTMTALVQSDGTWNATPSSVGVGTWTVGAAAPDPAGNVGSAMQTLTIATAAASGPGASGQADTPAPSVVPFVTPPATTPTPTPTPTPTAPQPTPSTGGGGGSIDAAARATVARSSSQKVKGSSLSIRTKVGAPAGGRITAAASGTVKIKGIKKALELTTATAKVAAGQSATLTLKLKGAPEAAFKRIRTAVRRNTKVTATITVRIVDAAGNTRVVKRTVRLTK